MLYLFYGPDEYSIQQAIASLQSQSGDPQLATLNTTILDGRQATVAQVIMAADAQPFLTPHRLVVVEGLEGLGRTRAANGQPSTPASDVAASLGPYLERLPDTTWLVLVEKEVDIRSAFWRLVKKLQDQGRATIREFKLLDSEGLMRWVQERVRSAGGRIEAPAARSLVNLVGTDLRLLGQEIDKLLAYVSGSRAITVTDVENLCSYAPEADVFKLVDALGHRDRRTALRLLHRLLDEGRTAPYLMVMIARQFRILLSIKDLEQQRTSPEVIRSTLSLPPFVVDKGLRQARNFSLPQLTGIYQRLVEMDVASKTGQMDPVLALDLFVVETCRG